MQIEKAKESLQAAELCYANKLYNSTANRAYYARFQAAVVALEVGGVKAVGARWSHKRVQSTFSSELGSRLCTTGRKGGDMTNKELEHNIQKMFSYIYMLAPEVRVEHSDVIYGDEDANLKVYPPLTWNEQQCDELEDQIAEHVVDTLVEAGYLILVRIYTPEKQVAQMRHKLALAQQQQTQANQFLAQAAALGLA